MTAGTYPEGGCQHGINKICVDVLLLATVEPHESKHAQNEPLTTHIPCASATEVHTF